MRVLHINSNYIWTRLHQSMIEHLNATDIESDVFVPTYFDRPKGVIKPNKNVIVSECFRKCDRLLFDYKQSKIAKMIDKTYDIKSYNCIHAYTLFTDGNSAMKLSKKYSVPYFVAVRNTDVNLFFNKMFFLRKRGLEILTNASAIFFLSKTYRDQVIGKYVPKAIKEYIYNKSYIIPNGIDDFWFNNIGSPKAKPEKMKINLLQIGDINQNKNILTTIKVIDVLKSKGYEIKLDVAGKIKDQSIFNKIRDLDFVNYLGYKSKEELINIYRNNDIFLLPSIRETFGLVYAEAMSQGLPVIYTEGQGFDGQFKDGEIGYAVDCFNSIEIADKIMQIVENYKLLSQNCINLCRKFKWRDIAEKYSTIYYKALSK